MSDSLRPQRLYSSWNSPDQNAEVGSLSVLQGIFPTQGSNPGLPHCRWILSNINMHKNHLGDLLKYRLYWSRSRVGLAFCIFIMFLEYLQYQKRFPACPRHSHRWVLSSRNLASMTEKFTLILFKFKTATWSCSYSIRQCSPRTSLSESLKSTPLWSQAADPPAHSLQCHQKNH